jgi:tRNA (guanine37-N1)-methyltransferase
VIEGRLQSIADRILMPLPEKAYEYLDSAVMALKQSGGFIHYYDFEHARKDEKPIEKVWKKVTERLMDLNVNFDLSYSKIVRPVGPRWFQIVLDVFVHKKC